MVYSFKIDTELGLVQEHYEGELNLMKVRSALDRLSMDSRFNPDLNNIVDMRECKITLSLEDYPSLIQAFGKVFMGGKGRSAYLVKDPKSTAMLMLFCKQTPMRKSAIFSTEEKAMEWLKVGSFSR